MKRTGKAKPGQVAESTPGEETYRAVFENTGTATAIVEEDTIFAHVNKEMERLSGCTRQELEGKKKWTDFVAGEDLPAMRAHLLKRLQAPGNASHHYEFRLIDRSGKAHDVYMTYALIPGTKQRIASLLDITKDRRMEAALHASQEELALLLESSLDAIFLTAPDGEIFYANRAACKMLGRTKEEICSLGRSGIIDTSDPRLSAALEERVRTGRFGGELTYVRKDGSKFPGEVSSVIYRDKEGRQRTSMIVRDLTERKRTKEALRAREEWYHTIFENTGTAMVTLEEDTVISHANKEFERLSGYTRQEIEGKKRWTDFVVPEDLEFMRVRHQLRRESQGSVPHQYEFRFVDRSGKVHDIFLSVDLLPGTKQSAASLLDITKRKRAEEALRASEALLSTVFNMSPIAIAITRLSDSRIINVNEAWEKVTGYSKQEVLARDATELASLLLHGERSKSIRRMAEQGPTRKAEVTIVTKSGGLVHFLMSSVPIQVAGQPCLLTMGLDFTEHKRAEEALRKSEMEFRTLVGSMNEGLVRASHDDSIVFVNNRFCEMTGYAPEDLLGKIGLNVYIPPECRDLIRQKNDLRRKGVSDVYELPLKKKSGEILWARVSGTPVVNERGEVVGSLGVFTDVTEQRAAEKALKEETIRRRILFEQSPDGILVIDPATAKIIDFNAAAHRQLGYSREEFSRLGIDDVEAKETHRETRQTIAQVIRDGRADFETLQRTKQGEIRNVQVTAQTINVLGNPVYQCIWRDITERKRAEARLQRSFEQLEESLEATIQAMALTVEARDPYTAGHQRRVADLAGAIAAEMGLSPDQVKGVHLAGAIHDVGKISVPAEILSKPAKLTPLEFKLIQVHSQAGYDILKDIDFPWPIARIVLEHHEHMNGSGYPNGLTGETILIESRIIAVADTVEAMASHRPYRPSLGIDQALEEIDGNKCVLFDADVVAACLKLFREKGYQLPS